eukprot:CAMPEP_0115850826 /NCGR_PEP_ID=MMETSP0287-20121206/12165_1 /TAXON_ID=412157 /ORGANISM="Chrysochromulina rotalis, Strain UIO044" /LENGTH=61 /DNA_ID=CAMNT_0003304837 /DNA_START=1416 /DNA_END=1597 /DNA_ORIENTATION=-
MVQTKKGLLCALLVRANGTFEDVTLQATSVARRGDGRDDGEAAEEGDRQQTHTHPSVCRCS